MSNTEGPTNDNPSVSKTLKVFIGNLNTDTTEDAIKSFFAPVGEVLNVNIKSHASQSKEHAFVTFGSHEEAEKAVNELNEKTLNDRVVKVQLARTKTPKKKRQAKKNIRPQETEGDTETDKVQSDAKEETDTEESMPNTSIFIANLPFSMKSAGLRELFQDYKVKSVMIAKHKSRRSKGYGFVELESTEEQQRVLSEFKEIEVEGRQIHIKAAVSVKKPKNYRRKSESPENESEKPAKPSSRRARKNKKQAKSEPKGDKEGNSLEGSVEEVKSEDKKVEQAPDTKTTAGKESPKDVVKTSEVAANETSTEKESPKDVTKVEEVPDTKTATKHKSSEDVVKTSEVVADKTVTKGESSEDVKGETEQPSTDAAKVVKGEKDVEDKEDIEDVKKEDQVETNTDNSKEETKISDQATTTKEKKPNEEAVKKLEVKGVQEVADKSN